MRGGAEYRMVFYWPRRSGRCVAVRLHLLVPGLGAENSLVEDMAEQVAEEYEESGDEGEIEDISESLKEFLLAHRPRNLNAEELERSDSKLLRLVTVLKEYFADNPDEKVILFSSFRVTAKYLSERLEELGMPSLLLWGGMSESKQGFDQRVS